MSWKEVGVEKAAMSLQGLWKMMQSIKRIRLMLCANWEKRWDRFQGWFYVNLKTNEMGWDPPRLLGGGFAGPARRMADDVRRERRRVLHESLYRSNFLDVGRGRGYNLQKAMANKPLISGPRPLLTL